jgi:hypothetical protein
MISTSNPNNTAKPSRYARAIAIARGSQRPSSVTNGVRAKATTALRPKTISVLVM